MKIAFLGANNPQILKTINDLNAVNSADEIVGFIDNDKEKQNRNFGKFPVLGGFEMVDSLVKDDVHFVNLITRDTLTRYETSKYLCEKKASFTNYIHPSVNMDMVKIGLGNSIEEHVMVQADVVIGNNCAMNTGTVIAHECNIGNSVFFAPRVALAGKITIGDGVFLGINSTVLPRLTIGKWATIGAGAVVTKNVPEYAIVAGNPARIIGYNEAKYVTADIFG